MFRLAHRRAKQQWLEFRERRRRQAIPRLATVIRGAARSHAVETLGLVVNQRCHHAPDPMGAAEAWLRQIGQ